MRFGGHVATRGKPSGAVDEAKRCGAEAIQIWVSNPRAWAPPSMTTEFADEFARLRAKAGIGPVVAHTSYMVNIASPKPEIVAKSVNLARKELAAVGALGADGLVVHAGAGGSGGERAEAVMRAAASAVEIAGEGDEGPSVLLELTAGGAGTVASTLPEAAELFAAIGEHPRIGMVIDTCHLFVAGYPLDTAAGVEETFAELRELGLDRRLRLIHANDAEFERGSKRDRHTHIGAGHIGEDGFRAILAQPEVQELGFILETDPGKDLENHRGNIEKLRALAGG